MKQYRASAFFIILTLILFALPHPALADQQWHYQASAQVTQLGLTETVLPAGVFFGTDGAAKTWWDHIRFVPSQPIELTYNHKKKTKMELSGRSDRNGLMRLSLNFLGSGYNIALP